MTDGELEIRRPYLSRVVYLEHFWYDILLVKPWAGFKGTEYDVYVSRRRPDGHLQLEAEEAKEAFQNGKTREAC